MIYNYALDIEKIIQEKHDELMELSSFVWNHPEGSGLEEQCADYQIKLLKDNGFTVKRYISLPTAFEARFGNGAVKIGFASEYDALPGLSQKCSGSQETIDGCNYGHGCGHNLICTGCMAAALALKELVAAGKLDCTVVYFGCAAEETLTGKHNMIEEGAFRDIDFCLTWHPFDVNKVYESSTLAAATVNFEFKGTPAHASVAPHLGRSALDAVEIMNVGANYLREHISEKARIHYIITNGGMQANVVPDRASSQYMIRSPKIGQVLDILERVIKVAKGASIMTETSFDYTVVSGNYEYNPNKTLNAVLGKYFSNAQLPSLDELDTEVFSSIASSISNETRKANCSNFGVAPYDCDDKMIMDFFDPMDWSTKVLPGSSDLGDVSYITPVGKIAGAAWALGTANHTWQAVACSGTRYASNIAILMGEIMAKAATEVTVGTTLLKSVREDFDKSVATVNYRPLKGYRIE